MALKVGMISLGCAKNLINTEQMMFLLNEAGFDVSGKVDSADVVVVNTCGFIESAKAEAIETILELGTVKAEGGIGKLVVAGCLPQRYKDEILQELPEIDAVIGTGSFDEIVDVIFALELGTETKHLSPALSYFNDINNPVSETGRIITTSPVWAYLKIAEGCDNRCAYCCIPDIRGRYRSRPFENIVSEARELTDRGVRELIVVAQDVTGYGFDLYDKRRLTDLLNALDGIEPLKWIRLLYLYPDGIDDELIDVISKSGKILKYLDIPVQHINAGILKKMHRRGTGGEIRRLIKSLRERIPGVVLRTSLITGLPGEGDREFDELCEFLIDAKFEKAGVFAYSPEEGTSAALMERPDTDTALRRAELLRELQSRIMDDFNNSRIGSVTTALIEGSVYDQRDTSVTGRKKQRPVFMARSYAEAPDVDGFIFIEGRNIKANDFIDIRITGTENGELRGEPI